MPNGEQALEQDHEGEDSAEESGEWESPADDDEDESDESDDEEVADSPPRSEHRSKQHHDPAGRRGKAVASSAPSQKRARSSTPELAERSLSSPRSILRRLGRPCLESRWTFLLLLGKCSPRIFLF